MRREPCCPILARDEATVYRGNLGEHEPAGIFWTLDVEVAKKFASMGMSLRGKFLGMYREDGVPTVWEAKVDPGVILAHFVCRQEAEVIVDPGDVYDAGAILAAAPSDRD